MPTPLKDTNLFKPLKVGPVTIKTRLAHAPTTRFRNTEDFVPTDSMLQYYKERSENNGGLQIIEATFPAPEFGIYEKAPLIDNERQVVAWKKIVSAIHEAGSFASIQLWNIGRAANAAVNKKYKIPYWSASDIYSTEESKKKAVDAEYPLRPITKEEIKAQIKTYVSAAKKAVSAGFDIVEIHAAHMYLIDQFIQAVSNDRDDEYGGSIENRSRLALEVVDAISDAIGPERTAIRLSPYAEFIPGQGPDARINPIATWGYILSELEYRGKQGKRLAYVSVVEPRVSGTVNKENYVPVDSHWINEIWSGVLVRAGALLHDPEYKELIDYVDGDDRTIIATSRYYTSNPDLVSRLKNGQELTPYDRPTFYSSGNYHYITWGKYGEESLSKDSALAQAEPKPLA